MEYIWKSDKECYKSLRAKPEEIAALKRILLW